MRGGNPDIPPNFRGGVQGGAIRGVIFFLFHEDRLTRKNRFLLGGEEGTGGQRKRGKETRRDRGRRKEGKEPARGKESNKLLEIYHFLSVICALCTIRVLSKNTLHLSSSFHYQMGQKKELENIVFYHLVFITRQPREGNKEKQFFMLFGLL